MANTLFTVLRRSFKAAGASALLVSSSFATACTGVRPAEELESRPPIEPASSVQTPLVSSGSLGQRPIFAASWPDIDDPGRAAQVTAVAASMGVPLSPTDVLPILASKGKNRLSGRTPASDVAISLVRSRNDLSVVKMHGVRSSASVFGATGLSEDAAVARAGAVLSELHAKGVIDKARFAGSPKLTRTITARGHDDVVDAEVVEAVSVSYVELVGGVPFPNSGVVVDVSLKSGATTRVRLGGALRGAQLASVDFDIAPEVALAKFIAATPGIHVENSFVGYGFDDASATIEPRLLLWYTERTNDGAGGEVVSRARNVGLPLRSGATVVDYSPKVAALTAGPSQKLK